MTLRRLGIIGAGGIADTVLSTLAQNLSGPLEAVSVLVRPSSVQRATQLIERLGGNFAISSEVFTDFDAFLATEPNVVAECASHTAVQSFGADILKRGYDLVIISVAALADENLMTQLGDSARTGGSRLIVPPGAIGGVDALAAARLSGLESVVYTGRKPPKAWKGTPAERLIDLGNLDKATTFFTGSARKAAEEYPLNANVTAALALGGIGFGDTQVRLVADPAAACNTHEIAVKSSCGSFTVKLEGRPSPNNPKTSLLAGYSVARELLNRVTYVVI